MSNMFTRLMIPVGDMLEKARRKSPRLVPKFITMTNKKGTTYQKKVWVAPDEIDKLKPSFAQFDLFGDEPEEVKKEEPRKKSNVQDKLDEKYNEWEKTPCALLSSQVASAFETNGATARKFLDKKVESGEVVVWNQGKNKNYAIKGSEGEAFMLRQIARNKERESKRSGSDNIQIVFDVGSIYIGKENNEKWRGIYAGNGNFEITGASDSLGVNAGDLFKPTELNTIGFMGRKANYTPPKEVQTPLEQEVAKELGEDKPVKEKTPAKQEQREIDTPIAKTKFRDYGSWTANGKDLKPAERLKLNQEVAELILMPRNELTSEDKDKILRYSGFGGVKADDERGVLYDFYTSPPVAKMTFQMISKIMPIEKGSSILEPSCGTGVFFDVAPEGTELQGVELDTRTATVASIIQEKAKIATGSFEQFNLTSDKQFNFVVGNAPFGDRSITTSFMDMPEEKSLDRYFLTRSLDKLESGGTMGMIVHPGVMDNKTNREWRIEMIKKGQFKGAVRLPDKSFKHTQTQVQPDTIFFRKYPEEVARRLSELDEQGLKDAGFFDEEWVEGTYYENNPSSMIGENQVGAGNWGRDVLSGDLSASDMDRAVENFQPKPDKTVEHVEVLRSMTSGAGKKEKEKEIALLDPTEASAVAAKTLTVGMTKTVDGRVYVLNANHRWERVLGIDEEIAEKIKKVKAIAEKVIAIREAMQKGEPADNLQTEAREIIEEYEKEYGELPATDKDIRRVLNANKALNGVYEGLVNLTDDILTKQNIYEKDIDIVDGHNPAIVALTSLERQHIDATAEMIEKYFPNDIEALIAEMNSHQDVFLTENGVFQLREDFLAGNAWEKIDGLKKAIEENPGEEWTAERAKWEHGIEQLEKAVGWISIEDADFMPQSSWIPDDVIDRWAKDKNGLDDDNYKRMVYGNYQNDYHNAYKFLRRNEEGKWGITLNEDGEWQSENDPLVYFLNSQKQRSTNIDTAEYNERQADNFRNWVANDPETREQLEQLFNRSFNAEISGPTKTYAIKIDGWNPNIVIQPWQWQSVHKLYKEGKGISALGTGFGKAQPLDSKILTPFGWKEMGDINIGDLVVGANGCPSRVLGVYPQGEKDIYELTFSDGGKAQSCDEHLWETSTHSERSHKKAGVIRTTKDLRKLIGKNVSIPIVEPIEFSKKTYEIQPYSMGVILGDGGLTQPDNLTVSTPEQEILDSLNKELPENLRLSVYEGREKDCRSIGIRMIEKAGSKNSYSEYLKEVGLSGKKSFQKFIPKEYLFGSIEDRTAILRGLMDTDGYVSKNGMAVQFSTSSPEMASGMAFLVRSLGGLVKTSTKIPFFTYKGEKKEGRLSYTLTLILPSELNPFRLTRKAERVKPKTKYTPQRYIRGIKFVGKKPAQCIMVEDPRHLYVTDDFVLTHNTYAGIALLALLRQEGKIKRPFLQVPNNKVKDWKKYFNRAMPGLKIGVIDPEEAGYSNQVTRYKQYQDLANGDYDVLIFPETSASEIQLSQENDMLITESVVATQTLDKKEKSKRIQEGAKETARGKLAAGKTNKTISFEDLGCDAIMVDEAHRNKNLFTSTLSRETGLNDGRRSDRAMSLFKKNEFIRRNHDKKNVFFLTATPLTNSPLEYYNMLMHVAPEELERLGIRTIDEFINNFADIQQGFKYDWGSGKSKEGKVLKGFKNIRSLQDMFFKYTDLQNDPSKIGLIKPKANNHPNVIPMQEAQGDQLKKLAIELEAFKNATKEEREDSEDNYLTFYTKMRTASLDLELFDPVLYKGWKNEKIETMAQNSIDSFKATGGGQVVFCDRVMSGDSSFNMHDKIKASMVAKGFKASEIVIVNGFTKGGGKQSDAAQGKSVSAAIEGFNAGKFKVIIGTTQTMGEGVNLQKNSAALHHLDIPYRPSDFIQRNGRVDRQGNKQGQVALHTYMAAGTIDNYSVGLVQGKANWIDQLLKTKSNVFVNPDDDSFVDPDELMLALTEEWGDKDQATERRAEMNRKKEEAIVTLNKEKAHNMLSTLSMMRGAIKNYTGDKGTIQYQNRLRKIDNLERGLSANPEFKNLDIISNENPDFMYDKKNRDVYQPGDVFSNEYGMFEIESFKYNTSEIHLKRIEVFKNHYSSKSQVVWNLGTDFPVGKQQPDVLKKPTEAMLNKKKAVFNPYLFTQQDNSFKKENYIEHIRASEHGSYIYKDKETGEIGLSLLGKYGMRSGIEILNPYDANDAKEIEKIYSQKELPSTYMIDEDEGINQDSGILDIVRNIKIEDYKRWKGSATIDKVITNEWQPVKAILEKVNKEIGGELEDYELASNIEKHPGYETDFRREDGKYQNYFRKKQMEKSITGKSIYDVQLEPRLVLKIKRRS